MTEPNDSQPDTSPAGTSLPNARAADDSPAEALSSAEADQAANNFDISQAPGDPPNPLPEVTPAVTDAPTIPSDNPPTADSPSGHAPQLPPSLAEQERMVEAILFASAEPVSVAEMNKRMPLGSDAAEAVRLLEKRYAGRGVEVLRVGDSWAIRTARDLGFLMRREVVETRKLSRAAIETLAIVAYHQPVTRAEIEEIRGVAVSRGTIDQLLELDWIRFGRRKMTPGRPVTFVVTEAFLDHFGLANSRDLPGLKELRASGLLDSRGLPGADVLEPPPVQAEPDPDEANQPDPEQPDMFGK